MAANDSIELWLVLTDPVAARAYIDSFDWADEGCPQLVKIVLNSGRVVDMNNMDDRDCVAVAMELLRRFEVPKIMARKDFLVSHGLELEH